MIKSLKIENFKSFEIYTIHFDRLNLLVGGNNCGKTTIFHALQFVFWCVEQTANIDDDSVTFLKAQVSEIPVIPYFNQRDIFHKQKVRKGNAPARIRLTVETDVAPPLTFVIYPAFSRNLLVSGESKTITRKQYDDLIKVKPTYIPGTIGITVKEDLYRVVAQERMIADGRQNQVIRNLVFRLKNNDKGGDEWHDYVDVMKSLFLLSGIEIPFNENRDEWLTAIYSEGDCKFDFVSAGSGFLQAVNLLTFLFLHETKVALIDEPDSHMHEDLQKLTLDKLDQLSKKKNIQLVIATHSPTFIDAAGLQNVIVIDNKLPLPLKAQNAEDLFPMLGDRGLAMPPMKVMDTLKSRKVLFVEDYESDFQDFLNELGEVYKPGFKARVKDLTVISTKGITSSWPFEAIACFEKLLGTKIDYVYVSDRDFHTDENVLEREARARKEKKTFSI